MTATTFYPCLSQEINPVNNIDEKLANVKPNNPDGINLASPDFEPISPSDALKQMEAAQQKYKDHNINLARCEFLKNIVFLTLSLCGVGLTTALTAFSGGGGLPLLALAGTQFLLTLADTLCAYHNWQAQKSGNVDLPRGSDSLANFAYKTAIRCNLSEKHAGWAASCFSGFIRAGLLVIPSTSSIFNVPHVARSIAQLNTWGGHSVMTARAMTNSSAGWYADTEIVNKEKLLTDTLKELAELKEGYKQLQSRLNILVPVPESTEESNNRVYPLLA